jgi:DNA-binding NarL/FixJ family response regulator
VSGETGGPTTVVVVDDEELFRSGLRMVIEARAGIEVVGEADNGAEAVTVVRQQRPDVVLMDVQMPRLNGIDATRRIVALGLPTRVLMLTTFGMDKYVVESLRAGASGFLLKTVPPEQLTAGIATVARGDSLLAPEILRRLIEDWTTRQRPEGPDSRLAPLTEREVEVLRLVGNGLSNTELAERLHLAEATVKTHVGRILAKTGSRDRVQAVVLAYETGLVRAGA